MLTVSVGHGCDGSPTTRLAIQIPESVLAVTPTRNPQWTVTKKKEKLAEPITDAHGSTVTERDAVVVYTAKSPLPDGYRDAFELSLKLPEQVGETLTFPSIQTCAKGETAWTEVAQDGQDPDELEQPAPFLTVTAPEEGADGTQATAASAKSPSGSEDAAADSEDDGGNTLGALGLGAGVLGLLAGGAALVQVQRRSRQS